jgi:hypothetical protein
MVNFLLKSELRIPFQHFVIFSPLQSYKLKIQCLVSHFLCDDGLEYDVLNHYFCDVLCLSGFQWLKFCALKASQSYKIFLHVFVFNERAWYWINFIKLLLQSATNFELSQIKMHPSFCGMVVLTTVDKNFIINDKRIN